MPNYRFIVGMSVPARVEGWVEAPTPERAGEIAIATVEKAGSLRGIDFRVDHGLAPYGARLVSVWKAGEVQPEEDAEPAPQETPDPYLVGGEAARAATERHEGRPPDDETPPKDPGEQQPPEAG